MIEELSIGMRRARITSPHLHHFTQPFHPLLQRHPEVSGLNSASLYAAKKISFGKARLRPLPADAQKLEMIVFTVGNDVGLNIR